MGLSCRGPIEVFMKHPCPVGLTEVLSVARPDRSIECSSRRVKTSHVSCVFLTGIADFHALVSY